MLTKFMTCIFPPSYFLFPFVCVPSIYSFYSSLPSSYVCTYLSPSIFCLSSSPSAKPTSSCTLCHIHVYIPFPAFHPHVSRATFLVIKYPASSRSDNSHSHFPFSHSHSTTLRLWLLKTNGYILVTFCFLIRTQHLVTVLPPLWNGMSVCSLGLISLLFPFPFRSCSLRSAL